MITSLQPQPESDLETWGMVFEKAIPLTDQELGYHIDLSRLEIQPDLLSEDEQQAVELYEFTLYEYANQDWQENEDRCRRIRAKILERKQERKKLWIKVKSHQEVVENWSQEKESRPENSTTRTMDAFYNRYYDAVVSAGVDPNTVSEVAAREDKFLCNAERAIARVVKNDDLTKEQKDAKICEIMEDAVSLPYASELSKKHLNGSVKLIRDIFYRANGEILVTFLCRDKDELQELAKHTTDITSPDGGVIPILFEVKDERIKQNVLQQLTIALAIIQSGDLDALSLGDIDQEVIDILTEYGVIDDACLQSEQ